MEITMQYDRRLDALGDIRVLPDVIISDIISLLSPPDVARLSCVSSVMYIFCNEEPLWMTLCLTNLNGLIEYKGSWKKTTVTALQQGKTVNVDDTSQIRPLHFDGFYSLFLHRRLYRCWTTLSEFSVDNGNVERKNNLSAEEFRNNYDGTKPVLVTGLADTWPARKTWTLDQLVHKYGDMPFRISQRSSQKIKMKLKDYVSYMRLQHDEDPLYIFDEKFGELAPDLLKDYAVPDLFQEDLFDVLDSDQRPPFRWLIMGPERSGASWHVDPALTSAWNTLLCGRKRWALYPPGKVPLGVTVHVDEEDGDVNIDTPSSLQWWLDYYPLLPDEDKPIECTQLPGETIFVPSGWWHCVLNLEPTIAVTQNFVNTTNFEFVCLDLAPGYRHKGVCRVGLLATDDANSEEMDMDIANTESCSRPMDEPRREKRPRTQHNHDSAGSGVADCCSLWRNDLQYEITFLSKFLDEHRDHYNSVWSSSNCIGQREMRDWLWKLWVGRPDLRDLIWKGACLAVNAEKWYDRLVQICRLHNLPSPKDDEKLPVGTGSNPVFLIGDNVVKIYVEGGLESSLYCLGTELEFYNLLHEVKSPLKEHVPDVVASGFICLDNGSYTLLPWDGKGIPEMITENVSLFDSCKSNNTPFGLWSKKVFDVKRAGLPDCEPSNSMGSKKICPYIVTKRCKGKIFAEIRNSLSWENALDLASFLGEQLRNLCTLPVPHLDHSEMENIKYKIGISAGVHLMEVESNDSAAWEIFLHSLAIRRKNVVNNLTKWGYPIPSSLIEKAVEYLPDDFEKLLPLFAGETCPWIHSDIMDDNLYLEPLTNNSVHDLANGAHSTGSIIQNGEVVLWKPSYLLDFSDLSTGDPILDLIPIHLDIFRGDPRLLKQLLASYKLPLLRKGSLHNSSDNIVKFGRPSYRAMCYCILHDDNVLGAVFSISEDLKDARSWEEVEEKVWGILNEYTNSS